MVRKLTSAGMYGLAVVWLFPLLWVVWTSVRPRELATSWTFSADFTLANFAKVWDAAPFAQYYFNTFLIVTGVLAAQIVTATLAAYAFAKL
ncbi:carbohydrate ABC transporter permease, partial [Mesorhizobium sp. M00.F.Ca.ET.186.01.1.1]